MPNVNIDDDLHQDLRAQAAAEGLPLHALVNRMLRMHTAPRVLYEYQPMGRRRAEDLRASAGKNHPWLLVWADPKGSSLTRAPLRVRTVHTDSMVVDLDGAAPFAITLDGLVDAVPAFPVGSDFSQGAFNEAESIARTAYMAWAPYARAVQFPHIWSNLR